MASNDFQSLLSTFQAASSGTAPISNENTSLLEATTQLWRLTQLKKSINTSNQQQSSTTSQQQPLHLAICLCIVDTLPHEEIWKLWMGNSTQVSLYIHAKHPEKITSKWLQDKLLPISHKPNWNDVRIIKAMLSLAQEAVKDTSVTHFYFGTESCLPITCLEDALQHLQHDTSYCQYYDKTQASRFEERECWSVLEEYIPSNAITKALPGWCVLCRSHVQAILDIDVYYQKQPLWTAFEHVWAPEEVYFCTCLSLLGLLHQVERKSLVHVEFNERARNEKDRAHPKEFDNDLTQSLVEHFVRDEECIFLRKVKRRMPFEKWKRIVLGEYESGDKRPRDEKQGREENGRHYEEDRSSRLHDGRQRRHQHDSHDDRHYDRQRYRRDSYRNDERSGKHGHYKR